MPYFVGLDSGCLVRLCIPELVKMSLNRISKSEYTRKFTF